MKYISLPHLKFLVHQVHPVEELLRHPYFEAHDEESVDFMLDAALQLADTYLYPYLREMDQFVPDVEEGEVKVHPQIGKILQKWGEDGWYSASAPMEWGGMQLPSLVKNATRLIFQAANNGAFGYTGSTTGASNLLLSFGNDELRKKYLPGMFDGSAPGTMALTEPDAGSSLSDITTSATPAEGGHYLIEGQKVFISGGDQDCVDNIIHLMLARIDGAPQGTKGISLFVVPKYREADGALVPNDVTTAAVFHKMGQKATPACHLIMGEKQDCHGWLVGEPHRGLSYMFQMMNEERLDVGGIAAAIASAAYYASLQYAEERPQGRRLHQKSMDFAPVPIVQHPDVRRMLLSQKAVVEGSFSLLLACAKYHDLTVVLEGEERERAHLLLELLTPIAKTYPAEAAVESVSQGLQVLGGYGYCEDFVLEQLYRDVRIAPIYEGTTGIQSLDLLGRKVMMAGGKAFQMLGEEINLSIAEAEVHHDLKKYAQQLGTAFQDLQATTQHLMGIAQQGKPEVFLADATLYLHMFSHVVLGWQWLKMATVAQQHLLMGAAGQEAFYQSKVHTMRFFFAYELRKNLGLKARLMDEDEVLTIYQEEVKIT
ncbi:MAG: acyl-CoA dehydrogenase [Bacteroidota bacterium]